MPGCSLLTSIEAFWLSAANPAGAATLAITVPNQAGLLGVVTHCQAAFLGPLVNRAGLSMTGAITLRLGGR